MASTQTPPEILAAVRKLRRLPSVESQLIKWHALVSGLQGLHGDVRTDLKRAGFAVYVRWAHVPAANLAGDPNIIMIAAVASPEHLRGRGWFWAFLKLAVIISGKPVFVESVQNPRLVNSLIKRGACLLSAVDNSFLVTENFNFGLSHK
jgi:hypothetical protein